MNGDRARLKQVFFNIIDNAVSTANRAPDFTVDSDGVCPVLYDYGEGIPEDELPYVKLKFYRARQRPPAAA